MSRQRKRRVDRQLDRIRGAQRCEDKLTDLLNYSWLQEFGRGSAEDSLRSKPTLPRIGFLERPDLSKR
jgi:hypothetical protein